MINNLKSLFLVCTILAFSANFFSCSIKNQATVESTSTNKDRATRLADQFINGNNVLVAAHRGAWRCASENSILAIEKAIEMGVDIVEIDLKKTKDNQLILMHDPTLNRTTTGKGLVKDHTLKEIKELYLKEGTGHKTEFKVPTLKEALLAAKGKVLLNLDKSYEYFDDVLPILEETGTLKQIIIKGYDVPLTEVKELFGSYYDSILYMPIIKLGASGYQDRVKEMILNKSQSVEFTFTTDTFRITREFYDLKKSGTRVWVNALWPEHNAGHNDDRALFEPDSAYGWLVNRGVNVIQTDRPQLLLEYLRAEELHN